MKKILVVLSFIIATVKLLEAATSYSNPYGSGDRRTTIVAGRENQGANFTLNPLIDGSFADVFFWGGSSGDMEMNYWFPAPQIIDEMKWYQSGVTAQGDWKPQGTNDFITYTDLGPSFTLGSSATQTISLSGNTTAYRVYRLLQTSGSTSAGPWDREIEFKIEAGSSPASYVNTLGTGDRTGTITFTSSGISWTGSTNELFDGVAGGNNLFGSDADVTGDWLKWDLGAAYTIRNARWWQQNKTTMGVWKWQGSNDNSAWTDLSANFTLAHDAKNAVFHTESTTLQMTMMGDLSLNSLGYRYYRILGISGEFSASPVTYEIEFEIYTGNIAVASFNAQRLIKDVNDNYKY